MRTIIVAAVGCICLSLSALAQQRSAVIHLFGKDSSTAPKVIIRPSPFTANGELLRGMEEHFRALEQSLEKLREYQKRLENYNYPKERLQDIERWLKQMDAYCRKVDENLKKVEEYQRQVEKSLKEIDRLQLKQYQIPPLPQPDWELRNDDYSSPHFLSPDNSQHLSKVYEQLRQVFEILNSAFKQLQKQLQQFR